MTGLALLGLVASVCLGVSDFLGGTLSRKVPLLTVLLGSQAVAVVVTLPRLLVAEPTDGVGAAVGWGVVGGLAVAVGVSSLYRALATGTMGVVAPLAALSVVVPLLAGVFTGDPLGPVLVVGMVVAVAGTMLASGPEVRSGSRTGMRPILLALLSALGFGVSNLTVAWGSAHHVTATLLANAVTALVVYSLVALVRRRLPRVSGRPLLGIAAIGVLGFLANLCFAVASLSGLLSVVAVLASLFPAVTVLLGWWVHRERLSPVQIVGVVLVLAGVGVIAAGG
ncbi:MAG: DMT family transporter [Propionicimonas sp.]|uniref:DMT family transporter n=1 Tax=Propionicimonas sp. TaxID=1955623 RepID=UPI002B1EDD0A|nr:DMT family transporter [Propionicimonas sp.]MEA4944381.1 DMT family transporter [Propionicimonas sp.]MEA5054860.1 DMT family transporter [Propionicimonas sp.]